MNPPQSDSSVTAKDEPIVVSITESGDTYVDDEKVPWAELGTALTARLQQAATKAVLVRGDKAVNLGRVVEAMDLARNAGAEKLAIATEKSNRRRP